MGHTGRDVTMLASEKAARIVIIVTGTTFTGFTKFPKFIILFNCDTLCLDLYARFNEGLSF